LPSLWNHELPVAQEEGVFLAPGWQVPVVPEEPVRQKPH
jgi:hypothetical protein